MIKDISFSAPAGTVTALVGARIITMKGNEVIEDGVIVVERNRIAAVGKRETVTIPADAKQIELDGKTIMPGMIDVHAHAGHFTNTMTAQ